MRLPFLRSKTAEADPPRKRGTAAKGGPAEDDLVAAARTRARRRLVGAVVLLAVGVVGFPILFDTQPRPLPLDTPIEVARQPAPAPAAAPRTRPSPVTNLPADAGDEVAPVAAASAPVPAPAPIAAASNPVVVKPVTESAVAAVKPLTPAPAANAPAPPPAPPIAAGPGRFVVQVGAYTDAAMLREARAKVEKLGLKTYTQVIEGDSGKPRTRVRLGPYPTREEADAAAAKVKRAGLPAAILTL